MTVEFLKNGHLNLSRDASIIFDGVERPKHEVEDAHLHARHATRKTKKSPQIEGGGGEKLDTGSIERVADEERERKGTHGIAEVGAELLDDDGEAAGDAVQHGVGEGPVLVVVAGDLPPQPTRRCPQPHQRLRLRPQQRPHHPHRLAAAAAADDDSDGCFFF
jgi:hypothetical protein